MSSNDFFVSIIIPVFNHCAHTLQCLESILRNTAHSSFEIIIFDNGSSDETASLLPKIEAEISELKYFRSTSNLGFSRACNLGAKQASGDLLLFLNNDTIVTRNWLPPLVELLLNHNAGAVGPKLVYPLERTLNHCGYVYNSERESFYGLYQNFDEEDPVVSYSREVQAILGAALLTPRYLFESVGGFAEMGLEDIDYCLSIRERGCRILTEPLSTVLHYGSLTFRGGSTQRIAGMDTEKFGKKWAQSAVLADDSYWYERDGFELIEFREDALLLKAELRPSYELISQGIRFLGAHRVEEALELFCSAHALCPTHRAALYWQTVCYTALGATEQALESLQKSFTLRSTVPDTVWTLSRTLISLGRIQEGKSFLEVLWNLPDLPLEYSTLSTERGTALPI